METLAKRDEIVKRVSVLSPPCGMETSLLYTFLCSFFHVLSPPCGMETYLPEVSINGNTIVLSPPCGMETNDTKCTSLRKGCSEPAVWDGDCSISSNSAEVSLVLSPPRGIATGTPIFLMSRLELKIQS